MSYELIALDMDGTLLNSNKHISAVDAEAVNKALENGKHVIRSTGRCLG